MSTESHRRNERSEKAYVRRQRWFDTIVPFVILSYIAYVKFVSYCYVVILILLSISLILHSTGWYWGTVHVGCE